ncbi:hypothetical protein CRG98_027191 [Punica granatum]|uniref:Uncharacterized protein n=1 Tax=Punica granatum TaxID=22663 RepID=A0A2I0J937_PUNGR|nr:hypothetical protein CRG98_027191 [Punica granatum]
MGPKFHTCSVFHDLCRAVRVDPITLGANDHYSHLRGSVRSQEPLTLPQNSIGSLHGDVRPDLSQSGLFSFQPGLLRLFRSVQGQNSPNLTQQRSNPTFCSPIPYLGISWEEHPDPGKQRAHGLPSMRGGRMLSRSFRARNDLLGPIQVRFPSFLVFSYLHEVGIILSIP